MCEVVVAGGGDLEVGAAVIECAAFAVVDFLVGPGLGDLAVHENRSPEAVDGLFADCVPAGVTFAKRPVVFAHGVEISVVNFC